MDILIVDDEEPTARALGLLTQMIVPKGWHVHWTTNASQGLSLLALDPRIRVAIVDVLQPGIAGDTLIAEAIRVRPSLRGKIIVCSGHPRLAERVALECDGVVLLKPFGLEEVRDAIIATRVMRASAI